jgi:hypothetical protein
VVVLSALVVVLVSNLSQLITYRNNTVALTSQTERQVVAAAAIATSEPTIPNSLPIRNLHASNLTIRSLIVFARQGLLPTGVRPSAADELAAHTFTQIGDTPDALYPSVGSTVTGTSAGVRITAGGSCASVTSSVVRGFVRLQVPVRTSLLVRDPSVGEMTIVLLVKGHRGPPISFPVRAGRANWLDDALSDSSIVVYLPSAATLGSC